MYPAASGPELTGEQARELDDTFLASDPFEYFRSRIASLVAWQETAPRANETTPTALSGSVRADFNHFVRQPALDPGFKPIDVHAQVAADALAVRHHAAESLLRFACARLASTTDTAVPCVWSELATGPTQIKGVLERLHETAVASAGDAGNRFLRVVVPAADRERVQASGELVAAANVFVAWFDYARRLLGPDQQIDLHAAHNKAKHGLAVRPRADMRMTFTITPPDEDGNMPVSAFTGPQSIDIFDQPVLEILTRGPKVDGHSQGLEITQLRLNPAAILADAYMLAWTHGAMFHVAAAEHFAGRDDLPEYVKAPPYPGLPVGRPKPEDIEGHKPLGMRYLLTNPPGGQEAARRTGIGFRDYFRSIEFDHQGRRAGRVVEG